jgi:predicted enzyme related to lactoylglutathione lyase
LSVQDVLTVCVPVSGHGRALAFYVGKLGLELTRAEENALGIRLVHVGAGATSLSLVTWLESMPAGSLCGLVFGSSDVQADYERLRAAGVDFDGPPAAMPGGPCQAVFYDPDGNMLVLPARETSAQTAGRPRPADLACCS